MPPVRGSLSLIRRARRMSRELAEIFPDAHCELDFTTPLELLVATVLSAQTTDVRVNMVTPALFARYRSAADYASAKQADVEALIRTIGLFRTKAANLIGIGAALCERFGGEVPGTLSKLVTLPGVGRKTANVVLGNAFDVPGLTVDTHFGRLARRWAWTEESDPAKVEFAVAALIERKDWTVLSHRVIWFGRSVCHAQRPACGACPLAHECPSFGVGPTDPKTAERLVKPKTAKPAQAGTLVSA